MNIQDRAAWFDNFKKQFAQLAIDLGFTAADVTAVTNDNLMMQFLADASTTIDAYSDGVRTFRRVLTQGDVGDPTPAFPDDPTFAPPPGVATGLYERLDFLVRRIRVSPAFTEETGAVLDINPKTPDSSELTKPVIKAVAKPGNLIDVTFVKGKSAGIKIEIIVDKGNWSDAGRFTKSPAEVSVPQNEDVLPRLVQIRARFLIGNHPVGDWSDTTNVQTIP